MHPGREDSLAAVGLPMLGWTADGVLDASVSPMLGPLVGDLGSGETCRVPVSKLCCTAER